MKAKVLIGLVFISLFSQAQTRTEFAFNFNPSINSQLFTFALVTVNEKNEVLAQRIIREDMFMQMIAGKMPSKANPSMVNLFDYIGFTGCELIYEEYTGRYIDYVCPAFDNLWKLWFKEHPHEYDRGEGFSHTRFSPSPQQLKLLHKYGIYHRGSYCFGDNMWQLLLDILNPDWVASYMAATE